MTSDERLRELAMADEPRQNGRARIGAARGTEVLLIRHAQFISTELPDEDPPITDLGREQAQVLAEFLAQPSLDAVFCAPTLRARQTAQIVADAHGLTAQVDAGLRETETYVPPGQTLRQALGEEAFAELQARFRVERRWDVYGEYRESGTAVRQRVAACVDRAIALHEGGRVAIVTHNPVLSTYIASLLGSPYDMPFYFTLTGVSVVHAIGDERRVQAINSTAHFHSLTRPNQTAGA